MQCTIGGYYDGEGYMLKCHQPTARKEHRCGECGKLINKGEKYELYRGVWEGEIHCEKTCLDCVTLREAFYTKGGYMFGNIKDAVREHVLYELHGDVSSDCILPLSPGARDFVFDLVQEAWAE